MLRRLKGKAPAVDAAKSLAMAGKPLEQQGVAVDAVEGVDGAGPYDHDR